MKKKSGLLFLFAILVFSIVYSALCAQLCPMGQQSLNSLLKGECPMLHYSFVHSGNELSALFIFPLIGLFFLINITFMPEGFMFPLFRPPRFQS